MPSPYSTGRPNRAASPKLGSTACSSLVTKTARMGTGEAQQEIHVARKVQGLQQHAKAGEQNSQEQQGENQHRHALQEGGNIKSDVLGQFGGAQETQQQPAQEEDEPGEGQRQDHQHDRADLPAGFGVLERIPVEQQPQADQFPDGLGTGAPEGGADRLFIAISRRSRLPRRRRSDPGRYPPGWFRRPCQARAVRSWFQPPPVRLC